jgi:hypothetical protein
MRKSIKNFFLFDFEPLLFPPTIVPLVYINIPKVITFPYVRNENAEGVLYYLFKA